jgi:hypothetical protein
MKVARVCAFVLLVKVCCWQGKSLRSEEGKVMGSDCLSMQQRKASKHLGWVLNSAEFLFGRLHYDKILIPLGGLRLGGNSEVAVGRDTCEACSTMWMLVTNTEFVLGPRKIKANLDWVCHCRIFRRHSETQPAARRSSMQTPATVRPYMCRCFVVKERNEVIYLDLRVCSFGWATNSLTDIKERINTKMNLHYL